jgi:Tol biopolymer transport system component
LKIVGEAEARRLTTDPAPERFPAWSPDGKQIAFVRVAFEGNDSILLVSPLGGSERRLLDFPTPGPLSWSPDGRWLAAARTRAKGESSPESGGIHLIPTGGGGPHAITFARPPLQDACPAFSPDGRRLAYVSCGGQEQVPACDVYVLALDPDVRPRRELDE